jgi:hypothetical protein
MSQGGRAALLRGQHPRRRSSTAHRIGIILGGKIVGVRLDAPSYERLQMPR